MSPLFRLHGAERIHAVANVDPFSGVGCLSRGIVGDVDGKHDTDRANNAAVSATGKGSGRSGRCAA